MRKILIGLALTSAAVVPMTGGVAHALDNANAFGLANGKSVLVTDDPSATCNPTAPTRPSDALCKLHVTGTFRTTTILGPTAGPYEGTVTLDYSFGPAAHQTCASAKGAISFFVHQNGKSIGQFRTQLKPATVSQPNLSKACATGQSPADADVSSTYFVGTIVSGKVAGFDLCGSTENSGSNIKNRSSTGALTGVSRDHSNSQALLAVKGSPACP